MPSHIKMFTETLFSRSVFHKYTLNNKKIQVNTHLVASINVTPDLGNGQRFGS